MERLSGYLAALPTPFEKGTDRINGEALLQLVERNLSSGLDGLYVGGSTGEAFLMSLSERRELFEKVAIANKNRGVLIAQVGDVNPQMSVELAQCAEKLGYDAISAVAPFYFKYSFEELFDHFKSLSEATNLPFIIYNFPDLVGVKWSTDQLRRLLEIDQIVGVKNTCSDLYAFERLRRAAPSSKLFYGFDETLMSGLQLGADGGIGSTYNIQAQNVKSLAKAFKAGDIAAARSVQTKMNQIIDVLIEVGVTPGIKYLLELEGIEMGACRRPFRPLTDKNKRKLDLLFGNRALFDG
jgi:N-acetylneuraminate lyase